MFLLRQRITCAVFYDLNFYSFSSFMKKQFIYENETHKDKKWIIFGDTMYDKQIIPNNIIRLCIDAVSEYGVQARMFHPYIENPVFIQDLGILPIKIADYFEIVNFPQASTVIRSFFPLKEAVCEREADIKMTKEKIQRKRGENSTFVINVLHRQNATWQGQLHWVEKNKSQNFRSALELLKLIDSALEQNEAEMLDQMQCWEESSNSSLGYKNN